ncbi:MAG: NUDIX hydrolase [Candidatus Saccharibacteria bacterium]
MATCAFAIIKDNADRILLVQIAPPFAESHKWNFPGGVIEAGEDIIGGLVREVAEETNIKCVISKRIDSFMTPNGQDEINIYDATYISGEISVQENEIIQAKWRTIKQALELPLAFNIRDYITRLYT